MKYVLPSLLIFACCMPCCMVGPKYQKPEVCMPSAFEEASGEEETIEDDELCHWWKQFDDPVLDNLLNEAIQANYDLLIAIEKIQQARSQYRVERSHLWPEIDFNATATRTRISQNLFPPPPKGAPTGGIFPVFLNVFQVGFDAIWEIDFFGKFRRQKRAAYYKWEATKEDAENVLISMLSEVAINYVGVRALQKKIGLLRDKIEADEEELAITKCLYEIGIDNEMQITTLISLIESDRAALPVLETSLKQTVYALAYLLGRQPEGLYEELQEERPIPSGHNRVPIGLPSDLLRRRPDIRSAERQLAAANEQIGAAVADLFPHVSLTGISFGGGNRGGSSVGFESAELNKLFTAPSRMFSVGAGVYWDVFDFGRVRGNIAVQNSLQKQALLAYEQTVIASLKDVESALVAYFEEEKRQASFREKVAADSRTLEITEGLFAIGLATELQVLEARKALLASESDLVESEQSLTGDLIGIYKALGGEWTGDCESSSCSDENSQ